MRVEVKSGTQARRLQISGFDRTDKKVVETTIEGLSDLLDRDGIDVQRVELVRYNSEQEADIIDDYVMAEVPDRNRSGEIKERHFKRGSRHRLLSDDDLLSAKTRTVLKSSEDKLVVERHFERALLDDGPLTEELTDEDSFNDMQQKVMDMIDDEVDSLEQKITELRKRRATVGEMTPEDV